MKVDYRKQLKKLRTSLLEVDKLIYDQEQLCIKEPGNFAHKISLHSLESHQKDVEDSIQAIEKENGLISVDLKLDSPDIDSGTIPLDILGNSLLGFQKLINSIGQSIYSAPTERGPFGAEVLRATQLQFNGYYAGSFGMHIGGAVEEDLLGEDLLKESLNKFKEVLEIDEEDIFIERLEDLGYRTINLYKDWLSKLETSNVSLQFKFKDKNGSNKPINKTPEDMKIIKESLDSIGEQKLEEVSFIGELVGGNIRSGKFEFVTQDESISGKATKAVKEKFKAHPLGGKFKASFEKVSFTNISKIVWTLVDIEDI